MNAGIIIMAIGVLLVIAMCFETPDHKKRV